nr:MAG TPA: hypothetical protein [Caudoviricetes sp.]
MWHESILLAKIKLTTTNYLIYERGITIDLSRQCQHYSNNKNSSRCYDAISYRTIWKSFVTIFSRQNST